MIIIVMGVSGSGKSTIGKALAEELKFPFFDADDFHPPSNKDKMASGIPLTDEDRYPWLQLIVDALSKEENGILACSALKDTYREILNKASDDVRWVYLKGDYETIKQRMELRSGHFMKAEMLRSQFEALEIPSEAINVGITLSVEEMVATVIKNINKTND
ncbi:gluconokinase [Fulvivirga sp.]|uniref:gluconokinase n=1 Tax=Fulvivirga sp. TaxID=1931237 RepID=UPI0032EC7C61